MAAGYTTNRYFRYLVLACKPEIAANSFSWVWLCLYHFYLVLLPLLLQEKYEALKQSASQSGAQIEDDVLFLKAVGGFNKKGTVYGLGSESEAYYERPTLARQFARATYTPSVLFQMEARLKNRRTSFILQRLAWRTPRKRFMLQGRSLRPPKKN